MARLSADELVDGGQIATPSRVDTDYGDRTQTPLPAPSTQIATSLSDYAAMLNASVKQGKQDVANLTDTSAVTAAKAEVAAQQASNAALAKQLGATISPTTGMIIPPTGGYTPTSLATAAVAAALVPPGSEISAATQDAFALLKAQFTQWGLPEAATFFETEMRNNIGPNQALIELRQQPFYQSRFAGNVTRAANNLNVLSEAEYIALENQYSTTMEAYGQKTLATKNQFATLIGNDVSATELKDRLDLAVTQVQQADPTVVSTLKQFYPSITDANLVSYFLAPAETLPLLQRQVAAADVGAAATQQGLTTNVTRAEQLAAYGVTYGQAQAGYGKIAEELPATSKLSQIYQGQTGFNYNQATAEQQYLMNSGAATLEQQKLKQLEEAQFAGRSGIVGANVAAGYSGSLGKSIQGQF
jgi:hypothetical protein